MCVAGVLLLFIAERGEWERGRGGREEEGGGGWCREVGRESEGER